MSEQFLGEIRLFANNFAPQGWALCEGQVIPIAQNQALFSLLGTTYGGDGKTTFALPDLRGRVPIHFNSNFPQGTASGESTHTLTQNEMPAHIHYINASSQTATLISPNNTIWAKSASDQLYGPASSLTTMNSSSLSSAGGGNAHENMQPYLVLNFCIALQGVFPSRN